MFFIFIFNNSVFCIDKHDIKVVPIILGNIRVLVQKDLSNDLVYLSLVEKALSNYKNCVITRNFYNGEFKKWYSLSSFDYERNLNSFFHHPTCFFYCFETNHIIFKHFTSKPSIGRNYKFIGSYYNFKNIPKDQYISEEFTIIPFTDILVQITTHSLFLETKWGGSVIKFFDKSIFNWDNVYDVFKLKSLRYLPLN